MDNNMISLLAEQNEILKAQLSEQRMINQQIQNSKEEQETEILTAFL